ncbi:HAD hydrolase family protein, partial [Streptococcus fryi]
MIKVIATDMDGTFLDSFGSYDKERFEHVLNGFDSMGWLLTIASGRGMLA